MSGFIIGDHTIQKVLGTFYSAYLIFRLFFGIFYAIGQLFIATKNPKVHHNKSDLIHQQVSNRRTSWKERFFKMDHSRPLFLYFRLFYKQLTENIGSKKVVDDRIRTADLFCWNIPLCQLSHKHCPKRARNL